MAHPVLDGDERLRESLDELISVDGDPYAGAVAVIAHVLERALGPAAGGMSRVEAQILMSVALTLSGGDSGVRIAIQSRGLV